MKYLIVSATSLEIQPLLEFLKLDIVEEGKVETVEIEKLKISILVTGVGMMSAAFYLGKELSVLNYDGIINAGIAGAFDINLSLGELVYVNRQQYGDLGASAPNRFDDVFELGLSNKNLFPFKSGKIYNNKSSLNTDDSIKKVRSISVNNVSGKAKEINDLIKKYNPQIEVMEGIAIHFACKQFKVDYAEVRTISNYVEIRDKSKWEIKLAIKNLNNFLIDWLLGIK